MSKHGHTLNVDQISKQVAKINQEHLSSRIKSSQISVQSVIKEALHLKTILTKPCMNSVPSRSKNELSNHLKNHINSHYKSFNSFTRRNHELVIVLEYYKLINNCISLEAGMVASGNLVKQQKVTNMIRRKQHQAPKHLPKIVKHRKYMYDCMTLLPSNINKYCGIHDGKHMHEFIYNMIGSGKLNYRTKKQLNKISINNRLYIFKATHNKRGVIKVASETDIVKVVNQLLRFLHNVHRIDHSDNR